MGDVFRECRERVTAQAAASYYGVTLDRRGWAVCPFHSDKHPSMSFKNGRFRCWACGASGDSIDFVGRLLGLDTMESVRRINADFSLVLPLDRQQTPAERQEAEQAARRQREVRDTYKLFEEWRSDMLRRLNACFREAHLVLKTLETPADLDRLTGTQALAIREQAHIEYVSDVLTGGTLAEQMEVFRERGAINQLCERILNSTPMKSGAA